MAGRKRRLEKGSTVAVYFDAPLLEMLDDLAGAYFAGNRSMALRSMINDTLVAQFEDYLFKTWDRFFRNHDGKKWLLTSRSKGRPRSDGQQMKESKLHPAVAVDLAAISSLLYDGRTAVAAKVLALISKSALEARSDSRTD